MKEMKEIDESVVAVIICFCLCATVIWCVFLVSSCIESIAMHELESYKYQNHHQKVEDDIKTDE